MKKITRVRIGHLAASIALLSVALAAGQTQGVAPAPAPAPAAPSAGNPEPTPTAGRAPVRVPQNTPSTRSTEPIYVTGNVTLPDGTEPPERVLIERICSVNKVRAEGYTDSKGRFGMQLGANSQVLPDASAATWTDGTQGFGLNNPSTNAPAGSVDPLVDCELRARLPGYRSSTIMLVGRRSMDNPAVGTLVLYPLNGQEGLAISGTGANAPRAAQKALEKGIRLVKKIKLAEAEKELQKAVDLYPKYAQAWLELGKTYAGRQRYDAARVAFRRAIQADPRFVYPYQELYKVAFAQSNWKELEEATSKLVRLNPYEFPAAYYYNGVAQFQLRNWDEAQKSLRQALDADKRHVNPKILYVMGLVLVQKHKYEEAFESLSEYAEESPNDPTIPKVRKILSQLQNMR